MFCGCNVLVGLPLLPSIIFQDHDTHAFLPSYSSTEPPRLAVCSLQLFFAATAVACCALFCLPPWEPPYLSLPSRIRRPHLSCTGTYDSSIRSYQSPSLLHHTDTASRASRSSGIAVLGLLKLLLMPTTIGWTNTRAVTSRCQTIAAT